MHHHYKDSANEETSQNLYIYIIIYNLYYWCVKTIIINKYTPLKFYRIEKENSRYFLNN